MHSDSTHCGRRARNKRRALESRVSPVRTVLCRPPPPSMTPPSLLSRPAWAIHLLRHSQAAACLVMDEGQTRGRTGASHSLERKQPEKRRLPHSTRGPSIGSAGRLSLIAARAPLVAHVACCLVPGFFFPACSHPVEASPFSAGGREGVTGRGSRAGPTPFFPSLFPWGTGCGRPLAPAWDGRMKACGA